jgi:DNA-binding NtrC family response regulator
MPHDSLSGLSVLIVEDEPLLRRQLAAHLEQLKADVTGAGTVQAARRLIADLPLDFVLLDVNLPDGQGTDLLREKAFSANTSVIVMTADGGVAGAVEAMRLGALDYLVKPFDPAEVPLVVARARRARQSARVEEHRRSDAALTGSGFFFGPALASLEQRLEKILAADQRMQTHLPPVLIVGETGTGKTTIARWLHHRGPRSAHPLVEMNCSAVPEPLAESELFGHERGAFTDARAARMGLFEAANGGTLFLDELPSLSPGMQAKVLKALEDHRIRRLGGNREIAIDVRVIAATHRDLSQLVAAGQFREDLYHRLDLYRVGIPPLRERGDDMLELAEQLMERLCVRHRLHELGYRVPILRGETAASVRMYHDFPQMWQGLTRLGAGALRWSGAGSLVTALLTTLAALPLWLSPFVWVWGRLGRFAFGDWRLGRHSLVFSLLITAVGFMPAARRLGSGRWALLGPIGSLLVQTAGTWGLLRSLLGRGIQWKDRLV